MNLNLSHYYPFPKDFYTFIKMKVLLLLLLLLIIILFFIINTKYSELESIIIYIIKEIVLEIISNFIPDIYIIVFKVIKYIVNKM